MVAVSGMGELHAERAAQCLVDAGARGLVSWGCAAGLDPELHPGALCLPQFVSTTDGHRWPIDEAWRSGVVAALGQRAVFSGTLVHAAQVLASGAAKRELAAQCGAGVADMESAAIARVAQRHGVPLLVVRSVVDPAGLSLPSVITEHVDESGKVPMGPLLRGLLRQPRDLITMLRLASGFRAALASLREVAACAGPDLLLEQALRQPPRHAWASSSTHAEWLGPCSTLDA
jgi:adenosylhomocysteine nucleosidase